MPSSPHISQRTVPMKDKSEHRVNQLRGPRPPEKRYLACHHQGRPDPGGLPQMEHPLPEKMGGHLPLEQEDGGGSAGDGLPTWEGCPSHHDPPDPGGGVPGVGWALERITAATRGHRNLECTGHQGSQCGTEPQHGQSPTLEVSKVGQCPAGEGEDSSHQSRSQGSRWECGLSCDTFKAGKGHKKPGTSGKSSTAEKTAIIPAAQEATAIIPTAQEASTCPAAQEATAIIPTAQEATAGTSPAAQEATAIIPTAQEATTIIPAAQEATGSTCPAAQEATAIIPSAQEATASTSPAELERTASTSPAGLERTASTSPAGLERTASS
ncbi:hypothetical protein NDU88_001063 [Pleurodeles waltl]|uniref:Skin secretory protein xP2-like n=1 Tax=Pleurodeles waltl TaxID=8319 RepID=A0AAV7VZZ6_PLEWA|nr:hypothetical protein NDU88_001063 [Pleurodeles waltl]